MSVGSRTSWRRELVVAAVAGTAIFLVSLLPYLLAAASAPAGKEFNGFFFIADDAATYVSKMREGAAGAWGWSDPYISKPVADPVALFLFYLVWGKLASLLHVSMYVGYHMARLSGAIALVAAARSLARTTLPDGRSRRVAIWLAVLGAGIGYVATLLGGPTILSEHVEALDLHLPELSGFYSIVAIPHFAWAAALMAWSVVAIIRVARAETPREAWRGGAVLAVLLLALCLVHPQMLFILAALAAIELAMLRPRVQPWLAVAGAFIIAAPLLGYYAWLLHGDRVIDAWSSQWRHQAPGPLSMLLGLGLPLALAAIAVLDGRGRTTPELRLMAGWVLLVLALLYIPNPVNIQRRLLDGLYLPVAMLAALGVELVARRRGQVAGPRVFGLVAASAISSFLVWGIAMTWALGRQPIIYVSKPELTAIAWLGDHPARDACGAPAAVLAHPQTGLFIPARSDYRVYVGHYSETIDYLAKGHRAFVALASGGQAIVELMRAEGVDYLFYGPGERAPRPGAGAAPADFATAGLVPVYNAGGVAIFKADASRTGSGGVDRSSCRTAVSAASQRLTMPMALSEVTSR